MEKMPSQVMVGMFLKMELNIKEINKSLHLDKPFIKTQPLRFTSVTTLLSLAALGGRNNISSAYYPVFGTLHGKHQGQNRGIHLLFAKEKVVKLQN